MSKLDKQKDAFIKVLTNESDRGCILVGASRLEYLLEKLIWRSLFSETKGKRKKLSKSLLKNGPFSSFWSRIEFVYAMGIINKDFYNDLTIIRGMRNEVAHNFDLVSFGDKEIITKTESLKERDKTFTNIAQSGRHSKANIAKLKFALGTAATAGYLEGKTIALSGLPGIINKLNEEI